MVSTKALLLLSVLLISIRAYDESDCTHDKIPQNPGTLFIEEDFSSAKSGERHLASYSNFRIYPFYDILDANSPSAFASYIKNKLIPPAVSYFQAALKIKYPVVGNLKLDSSVTKLCDYSTPSIFKSTGVPADIVIIYDSDTQSGTQIAATSQCYVASGSGRTLISQTMINRNMIPVTTDVLIHERNMYTLMHEMMHSFGFSSALYPRFLDDNGNQRSGHIKKVTIAGSTRTVIDVPSLTEKLRTYYGCSTVPGLILENSGGSDTVSSHVERKFFVYDAMSSGSIFGRRFSQFSLGLLEASGWFVVDYSYAEPFFYGKGQGCSFVTGTCSSTSSQFDEFCTGSSRGCSPTGRGGGSCQSDSISDGCKYYFPSEDNDCENDNGGDYARFPSLETYGRLAGSKCFTGNLNSRNSNSPTSFCFKYSCSGSGSSTQLTINVGNNKVTCTQAGTKTIDGYYGSVDCPNPQEFCETVGKQYCPRNCMGRGSCVNNKCVCNSGYSGIDCALTA